MKDYRFRVVPDRNHLVEKILIFDAGLDDRVIEGFKLLLKERAKESSHPLAGTLFFASVEGQQDQQVIRFEHLHGDESSLATLPFENFAKIGDWLASKLPSMESELGKPLRVDAAYAAALFESAGKPIWEPHRA